MVTATMTLAGEGPVAAVAGGPVIGFDLSEIDDRGLIGPEGGKRAVDYELCIPDDETFVAEVRAIDPSLRLMPGSPGRIGCHPGQLLVLGSTHRPGFRSILQRLADLPYVERIERAFFE
jgi:hypothetical protein